MKDEMDTMDPAVAGPAGMDAAQDPAVGVFGSVEPVELWMGKNFPALWRDFQDHCHALGNGAAAGYLAAAFRSRMAEWLRPKPPQARPRYRDRHGRELRRPAPGERVLAALDSEPPHFAEVGTVCNTDGVLVSVELKSGLHRLWFWAVSDPESPGALRHNPELIFAPAEGGAK